MKLLVNINALEAIRNREVELRDSVPEHTMDWYTYDNRVKLIDEIADTFSPSVRVTVDDEEDKKTPKLSAKKSAKIAEVIDAVSENAKDIPAKES